MEYALYILVKLVHIMLSAVQFCMLLRAILSWLPFDDDSPLVRFTDAVTEPLIYPVRRLLERSETVQMLPIDLSFFITFILLSIIQGLLPAVNM